MKKQYRIVSLYIGVGLLVLLLLNSCTSAKTRNLLQDKDPVYTSRPFKDYKLQYNDEIYCTILTSNTDFSNEFNGVLTTTGGRSRTAYTIYETGNISIPYFGEMNIVGRTIQEAEEIIQNRMRQAFPDAQVKVVLANNAYFVVSDETNGRYPLYKDNTTIYQALAVSGRPSDRIDLSKVKIVRTDEYGKSYVKTFDMRSESVIESEFYYIKPNDIIYYSTSTAAFFRINSYQSLISTLLLPISTVIGVFALIGRYK